MTINIILPYKEKFTIDLTPIEITICDGVKIKNLQTD